ncbi:mitochondrial amino-acid acetyltransferase [Fomitiporia mediterranea MF3/22]|uniref:mitochondrial amino-acid acetyltransferase n=1 Tax=Fomitiporia mediterranea (strain MF3/22) TaxID=694068 RepID=UPI0004409C96|nr:mitochondrial amino-acid acetyltransferase [Fomitiporia mediterranea MF3/22]EJD03781.1 mitochondrial amino-acid acetyltransferase [Fomitiporia mediterranea MF3/22]
MSCLLCSRLSVTAASGAARQRLPNVLASSFASWYQTIRHARIPDTPEADEPNISQSQNDFILSILRANPSLRDTKSYLQFFGPRARPAPRIPIPSPEASLSIPPLSTDSTKTVREQAVNNTVAASILEPVYRRTALVKLQGPFTDRQLESIATGLVYLEKLGLTSVIVIELDNWVRGEPDEKSQVIDEVMRVVSALEGQGARARPVLQSVVRLGPDESDSSEHSPSDGPIPEAHTLPHDLFAIRSALRAGEIPVLPPLALDSFCRSVRIHSNDVLGALAKGMTKAAESPIFSASSSSPSTSSDTFNEVDLAPLRLMVINKEGGVPSYARNGLPHLLVNLTGEYRHVRDTFHSSWYSSHPTALQNLALARTCLSYMPPSSSAIMVSHRSPKSLIGNLITNKPELSSSLPHALLQGNGKLTAHTPTILRKGMPIRVVNSVAELDREKLTSLLESSFRRTLDQDAYFRRLEKHLDFAIIAGDYAGAAIVTNELPIGDAGPDAEPITYLDKFAVRPENQGDGTVDFLWVALHDESYGLGLSYAANPNGGKEGRGEGRDLVWRSRADNPVNKWYFERSTGHLRIGKWVMFWCDAEKRLQIEEGRRGYMGLSKVEEWEQGRLSIWAKSIGDIPSAWSA